MIVFLFWAKWYSPCDTIKDMMEEMCPLLDHVKFAWVSCFVHYIQCEAETEGEKLVERYQIKTVPHILLIHVSFIPNCQPLKSEIDEIPKP